MTGWGEDEDGFATGRRICGAGEGIAATATGTGTS